MAWQPIQPRQTGPSPFMRAAISRGTLTVVALTLLFAGYKCVVAARGFHAEAKALEGRQVVPPGAPTPPPRKVISGAALPMAIGIGLLLLGTIALAGAVLPSSFFERFVKPPGDAEGEAANVRRYMGFLRWPF